MSLSKLKIHRMSAGLTQTEAGNKIGVSKFGMSRLENQHRKPTAKILQDLADVYGVETTDLVGDFSMGNGTDA